MTTNIVNIKFAVEYMHISCAIEIEINNANAPQGLKLSAIPYIDNQFADLQLWDSNFYSISLFSIYKYLEDDTKNIICSLLRIVVFIKQWPLENKMVKDIPQISKFGFVAWEFLSAIYKFGWNMLTANSDNWTSRQYVSL